MTLLGGAALHSFPRCGAVVMVRAIAPTGCPPSHRSDDDIVVGMGAWGVGPFENDGAADLVGDIDEGLFSFEAIEPEFEDESYLEVDGGQWVIALAEIVVSSRDGRELPVSGDFSRFVAGLSPERIAWIHHHARRAVSSAGLSELFELWEEAGELDEWLLPARDTIAKLSS